jgi:hypothetical protein
MFKWQNEQSLSSLAKERRRDTAAKQDDECNGKKGEDELMIFNSSCHPKRGGKTWLPNKIIRV